MKTPFRTAALALALPGSLAMALPATAATAWHPAQAAALSHGNAVDAGWEHSRGRRHSHAYDQGYGQRYYGQSPYQQRYYEEPVYANTSVWRGDDGRYYCRKKNGTTGLIIGGAAGALLGREIAGGGDRTLGTILGAAGGALLGRSIDRSGSRCR